MVAQHYAFAVDDETLDRILARVRAAGLEFSADPTHRRLGELNDNDGGRGFYVCDPDGHNLEFLTRPITARPLTPDRDVVISEVHGRRQDGGALRADRWRGALILSSGVGCPSLVDRVGGAAGEWLAMAEQDCISVEGCEGVGRATHGLRVFIEGVADEARSLGAG